MNIKLKLFFLFLLGSTAIFAQQTIHNIASRTIELNTLEKSILDKKFRRFHTLHIDSRIWSLSLDNAKVLGNRFNLALEGLPNIQFRLIENDILAADYKLVVASENGNAIYPKSKCMTFEGYIDGFDKSLVSLTIKDGFIFGFFKFDKEKTYYLEPLNYHIRSRNNDDYILYDTNEILWDANIKCGYIDTETKKAEVVNSDRTSSVCRHIELAIASDESMLTRYGSASAVEQHNIGVMNNVNTDYRNNDQFADNIEFKIVTQYQSTSSATEPLSPNYTGTNSSTLLGNFAAWGPSGFGVTHDLGQFWSTRDFDNNGVIGLAYTSSTVICSSARYHILEDYDGVNASGSGYGLRVLASHEIGHNFGCSHDGSTGFIMSPSVNATSAWSAGSISTINSTSSSRPCLSPCSNAGAPVANIRYGADIICENVGVELKDNSTNGPTSWNWSGTNVSLSPSSTSRNVTATFTNSGSQTIALQATNASGSNTISETFAIYNAPTAACAIGNTSPANSGIVYFQFGTLSKSSGTASADGNEYMDFTCSANTFLLPNTSYPAYVGISGANNIGFTFYIDYNNDGTFTNATERVFMFGPQVPFNPYSLGNYTTSASPTMNTLLRARVLSNTSTVSSACTNPTEGQVEDYGIVFVSTLPVEWLGFEAKNGAKSVELNWQTINEFNNKGFEVQRSYDAENFEKISFVEGRGFSNYVYTYTYEDKNVNCKNKNVYYRLNQIDTDGRSSFSKIRSVELSCHDNQKIKVFPNPMKDNLSIDFSSYQNQALTIQLIDINGKIVASWFKNKGQHNSQFDTSDFQSGVYLLKINNGLKDVLIEKIIK